MVGQGYDGAAATSGCKNGFLPEGAECFEAELMRCKAY